MRSPDPEGLIHEDGDAAEDVGHEILGRHGHGQTADADAGEQGAWTS